MSLTTTHYIYLVYVFSKKIHKQAKKLSMAASEPQNTAAMQQPQDEVEPPPNLLLPKETWFHHLNRYYQGFWCPDAYYENVIAFQTRFQAHDTDIILASLPKSGTTWLKSLIFTTMNRKNLSHISQHTLHSKNPHELMPPLDLKLYNNSTQPNLTEMSSPRLFSTHMSYLPLPNSIKTSKCRIVYVCRNPLDTFVSLWHFHLQFDMNKGVIPTMEMMEEYVGKYCKGASPFGPYEDHLLGYWKESKQNPQKVLFLEYEGLKKEPKENLKRLAEFLGCPFSEEEEKEKVMDEVIDICSLKNLKEMEVNKSGKFYPQFNNEALFRKGKVGDWINHLTPSMAKQFDLMLEKLKDAGFCFTYYQMKHVT